MECLFTDTRLLDGCAKKRFLLTDDIMMENAARALQDAVCAAIVPDSCTPHKTVRVLIVCGSGNNGGDGYALARRLHGSCYKGAPVECVVYAVKPAKTAACISQYERAKATGVFFVDSVVSCEVLVDCLFGSGFTGALSPDIERILCCMNASNGYKIACDVPSALGSKEGISFCADVTVTMGALKTCLFDDGAKDRCGKIVCGNLGISRAQFESLAECDAFLLQETDAVLPHRTAHCTNKGDFGHTAVIMGEKSGAAIIASTAAFAFGSGLVSLVAGGEAGRAAGDETAANSCGAPDSCGGGDSNCYTHDFSVNAAFRYTIPQELMIAPTLPSRVSSVAVGMGLGKTLCGTWAKVLTERAEIPCVIDADMFYCKELFGLLTVRCAENSDEKVAKENASAKTAFSEKTCGAGNTVLTPHPKECAALLNAVGISGFENAALVQKDRLGAVKAFCTRYPRAVLLLKGANPIIGYTVNKKVRCVINPFGTPCLAKAGSGDVLSGLVAALLAQGYDAPNAATGASLAHALSSGLASCDYALTPTELIECVKKLGTKRYEEAANGSRTHLSTLGRSCNTDIR